jgi:hypothetical protein
LLLPLLVGLLLLPLLVGLLLLPLSVGLLLLLLLSPEEQSPIENPKILMQGIFGMLISMAGGFGKSTAPGGGPGITPHKTMGTWPPGGSMTGTTVALCDPGDVVVIH